MAENFLITGFPGFIGRRLVQSLANSNPKANLNLLVEPRMVKAAQASVDKIPGSEHMQIVAGDITDSKLGLDSAKLKDLANQTTHVYHLAAIYDLAVASDVAQRVNVDGTINVVDFCRQCGKLDRLHYVSTAYVAGDRHGTVYEHELQMGQSFKNHYESTKFQAEVVVREARDSVPTTIYRPAIVVGDSQTGETQKFDGPYYALKIIAKLNGGHLPLVRMGSGEALLNVVPVDFVVEAMATLALDPSAVGETLHLTDPNPVTADEVYELFCLAYAGRPPRGKLPTVLTSQSMRFAAVRKQFGNVPRESLQYLDHVVRFDTRRASTLLAAHGVRCPSFTEYVQPIVEFFRQHEQDPAFQPKAK